MYTDKAKMVAMNIVPFYDKRKYKDDEKEENIKYKRQANK